MLRFLTSGESHGQALVAVLDGFPSGLAIDMDRLNKELQRRQQGYGRGARQKIEKDEAEIIGGMRHGATTGAPLTFLIRNRDFDNWQYVMSSRQVDTNQSEVKEQLEKKAIKKFRPGHADLPGTIKFKHHDIRDVLERASARETAARVAVGATCEQLLSFANVHLLAHVRSIGPISCSVDCRSSSFDDLATRINGSEMFCLDQDITEKMKDFVRTTWQNGDSTGGVIEVICDGLPVGLGSYTQWDEKLDGKLAQAVMSIQAIKAVEIGDGTKASFLPGSQVHDAIFSSTGEQNRLPFTRRTNHAGGIEGGMSNGERLILRAYMKPIPTMRKGLPSITFPDLKDDVAHYERSDVCAVPAASVVVKAMVAFVLAREILQKFGGDHINDLSSSLRAYRQYCQSLPAAPEAGTSSTGEFQEMELE